MLTRSYVSNIDIFLSRCMMPLGAGEEFDPMLLPEPLETPLLVRLKPTQSQWQMIKTLKAQRQKVNDCLHMQKNHSEYSFLVTIEVFTLEMQRSIGLEYDFTLISALSRNRKPVDYFRSVASCKQLTQQ